MRSTLCYNINFMKGCLKSIQKMINIFSMNIKYSPKTSFNENVACLLG